MEGLHWWWRCGRRLGHLLHLVSWLQQGPVVGRRTSLLAWPMSRPSICAPLARCGFVPRIRARNRHRHRARWLGFLLAKGVESDKATQETSEVACGYGGDSVSQGCGSCVGSGWSPATGCRPCSGRLGVVCLAPSGGCLRPGGRGTCGGGVSNRTQDESAASTGCRAFLDPDVPASARCSGWIAAPSCDVDGVDTLAAGCRRPDFRMVAFCRLVLKPLRASIGSRVHEAGLSE